MRIQEAFFPLAGSIRSVVHGRHNCAWSYCRHQSQGGQLLAKRGAKEWSPTTTWFAVRRSNKTALPVTIGPSVSKIFIAQFSLYFYVNKENPTEKLRLVKYSCDFPSKPGWM